MMNLTQQAMEDRLKALKMEHPQRVPARVELLPAAFFKHREALQKIIAKYPYLFALTVGPEGMPQTQAELCERYMEGRHVDEWGCVWENVHGGISGQVVDHPVKRREDVHKLRIPEKPDGMYHGFMFLRLTYLRGYEEIMIDFAEEPPELQMLIDKVLEYNLRQVKERLEELQRAGKKEEILFFGDDLGIQNSLAIHPDKWRKYLKRCYRSLFQPIREAGHYVYFHTDGYVIDIIPDLIECGVNVLNVQVNVNGLDNLARTCRGRVCVDADPDRQKMPFWSPSEIESHVREIVERLGTPEGGLWIRAEVSEDVPIENVEALCASLERYSSLQAE